MQFKAGDKLTVTCSRKGTYDAVATADFDTERDEWYQVAVDQDEPVQGLRAEWARGCEIPCRRGHATVSIRREKNQEQAARSARIRERLTNMQREIGS